MHCQVSPRRLELARVLRVPGTDRKLKSSLGCRLGSGRTRDGSILRSAVQTPDSSTPLHLPRSPFTGSATLHSSDIHAASHRADSKPCIRVHAYVPAADGPHNLITPFRNLPSTPSPGRNDHQIEPSTSLNPPPQLTPRLFQICRSTLKHTLESPHWSDEQSPGWRQRKRRNGAGDPCTLNLIQDLARCGLGTRVWRSLQA